MSAERARLLRIAEKVSDGRPIDWDEVESHSGDRHELAMVRRLRLVSSIAATNRRPSRPDDPETPEQK